MEHEDFVTYEQAVELKKLGFDWEEHRWYFNLTKEIVWVCIHNCFDYENMTQAPTLVQVQKWLREVHRIAISPYYQKGNANNWSVEIIWMDENIDDKLIHNFDTYEQALSTGIDEILKYLKQDKNGK